MKTSMLNFNVFNYLSVVMKTVQTGKVFLTLFLFCISLQSTVAQSAAQVGSENSSGLLITTFKTIEGTVKVYLPSDVNAGEKISGTVTTEPTGNSERQIEKNSSKLSGCVVEIADQEANTKDGKGTWIMPTATAGTVAAILLLKDSRGNELGRTELPVKPRTTNLGRPSEPGFTIPDHLTSTQPVEIEGTFDGDFESTEVMMGGEPCTILAESEHGIFVQAPDNVNGETDITISENDMFATASANVIGLNLAADQLNLQNGQTTDVSVIVSGLQGIDEPVNVTVTNLTPGVISMSAGLTDQITIFPEDVTGNGNFVHTFPVTGNLPGTFSIGAEVAPSIGHTFIPAKEENPTADNDSDENNFGRTNNQDNLIDPLEESTSLSDFLAPENFPDPGIADPELTDRPQFENTVLTNDASNISFGPNIVTNTIMPAILAAVVVDITDEERQRLRNEARNIPENTPMTPSDPDDHDAPYSRPVPPGLGGEDYERGSAWSDTDALLRRAKEEVEKAENVTGHPTPGVPGYGTIGLARPDHTISKANGCTEYVYYFYQRFTYLNDVTLVSEEQLSPSYEFFMGNETTEIDITHETSEWSVTTGVSAGLSAGPASVSIGVSGTYGESTTHITGTTVSRMRGRHLWMFHIGRLYLYRKAFLRITYEYHYEVCADGSTRNWVETTYEDNWYYAYKWIESLIIASRDDEGNFHEIETIPLSSETVEDDHMSYEADCLEPPCFDNPGDWDFFPQVQ